MKARRPSVADAARFRDAHHGNAPLVLPNAWDAASAAAMAEAGAPFLATSSGAVSRALGYSDGEGTPPDVMFAAIERIAIAAAAQTEAPVGEVAPVLVTADIEHGYGLAAADLVQRLANAGAVGCNIEDSDPTTRALMPAEVQAARVAELRRAADEAGTGLVINARVDVHVRRDGPESTRLDRSVARAKLYLDAGADCVFPILMTDEADIAAYVRQVPGPVNIMATTATPSLRRLAHSGVARVSFGSGLQRVALDAVRAATERVLAGDDPWP